MIRKLLKSLMKIGALPLELVITEDDDFALVEFDTEEIYLYKSDGILYHSMMRLGMSKQESINAIVEAQYRETA